MPETVPATCEDCGKKYRVPNADRTYTCKACGGTVRADEAPQPEKVGAAAPARSRRRREDSEDDEERAERPSRRRRTTSSSKTGWYILGLFALVAALGGGAHLMGFTAMAMGQEKDLDKVMISFAEDWESADLDALADWHHPSSRKEFRRRLDKVAEGRGWAEGFPAVTQKTSRVTKGSAEEPAEAMAALHWGETPEATGTAMIFWQFEPSRTRWYIYELQLPPSAVGPRVEEFRAAWNTGELDALRPLFRGDRADKMIALVEKSVAKRGWDGLPELKAPTIDNEDAGRDPLSRSLGGKAPEAHFPIAGSDTDELMVKWAFRDADDRWNASGFRFP